MKHNRSEQGFSLYLILALIIVVGVIGFGGWYVVKHQVVANDTAETDPSLLQPGSLEVNFKDGVTLDQAVALIESQKLTVKGTENYVSSFTPEAYRGIKKDKFDAVLAELQKYPEVASATDDSADPSNNRAGNDEKWLKVVWNQNVTSKRITEIEIATGMGAPTQPNGATRSIYITVPEGQENEYIKEFKKSPLVLDSSQMGRVFLQ